MRAIRASVLIAISAACASAPASPPMPAGGWSPEARIPCALELTCGAEGTIGLSSEIVQARPHGVHLRVTNQLEEPVNVGRFDASPGTSTWTWTSAPGDLAPECRSFSQHSTGRRPPEAHGKVVDPLGMYPDGRVACADAMFAHGDPGEPPVENRSPPLDTARAKIIGLRPDDVVTHAGYPERDKASVIVIPNGQNIASYAFVRFSVKPWSIGAGTVCSGTGLSPCREIPREGSS